MKKAVVLVMLVLLLFSSQPVLADQTNTLDSQKQIQNVVFKIDSGEYYVNGQAPATKMNTTPSIDSIKAVAVSLGFQVVYDASSNTVSCWAAGTEKPDVSKIFPPKTATQPLVVFQCDTSNPICEVP